MATLADLTEGRMHWHHIDDPANPIGWRSHNGKSGWSSMAAARSLGDDTQFALPKEVQGIPLASDLEMIDLVMRDSETSITGALTGTGGGSRWKPLGEPSFLVAYLAELLNRVSP
jgi:hypothetical protein